MATTACATACAPSDAVSFLVCYGERKRPITLSSGASLNELRLEVVETFRDVLPSSSSATAQGTLILQIKSEEWDGTFLDLKEGDPLPMNRSVLRIVSGPSTVCFCVPRSSVCCELMIMTFLVGQSFWCSPSVF